MSSLRDLIALPRSRIVDAPLGEQVKIVGRVALATSPLVAPLTGRPCVFYDLVTYEETGKVVHRKMRGVSFFVEDRTGRALVRLRAPFRFLYVDFVRRRASKDAPGDVEALLHEDGLCTHTGSCATPLDRERKLRYQEGILAPDERVAVAGMTGREVDPDRKRDAGVYRDEATILLLRGSRTVPLLLSDIPAALA
jgi:hypothetical protein